MKNPSAFTNYPWNSVLQNSEPETIACNIMNILKRTGDTWRALSWEEYCKERLKDGNFSETEKDYFEQVIGYCCSEQTAKLFSPDWKEISDKN